MDARKVSVVVPLFNEEQSVRPLVEGIRRALDRESWEILLVDDGSTDGTVAAAEQLSRSDDRIRVLRLARNYGQTAAMKAGFDHARGSIVVSMDGDLQNDPRDIPLLIEKLGEGFDLVAGYRENRQDKTVTRKVPSWIANALIRWISGVNIRDTGCSLKAYRAPILRRMVLYSDMHRFIPAMAAATGGARIAEIRVRHHPRRHGSSKYGLSRTWRVLLDLITLAMIRSFRDRPLRMFGLAAVMVMEVCLAFTLATVVSVSTFQAPKLVFPASAIVMFGLSTYLLMLGLVGEVLVRQYQSPGVRPTHIAREIVG
ncbi:MAG TPA: glycosyltransferase family 2 protein [Gemmatimonadota bacterium]|nr:glycosyltransferase family 2 protein [Gemmatimonadota bacterium]